MSPSSTRLERFSYVAQRVIPSTLLLWVVFLGCTHLERFELFAHARVGELLLERSVLSMQQSFGLRPDEPAWADVHWLFQSAVAQILSLGGLKLLSIFKAFVLVLTLGLAYFATARSMERSWKALLWIVPTLTLAGRSVEGPELFAWLCLALQLHLLARAHERALFLWAVPVVQVLWANTHGLHVLGPLIVASFLVDRLLRTRLGEMLPLAPPTRGPSTKELGVTLAATTLACFANPHGSQGVFALFRQSGKIAAEGDFFLERLPHLRSYTTYYAEHRIDIFLLCELALGIAVFASFLPILEQRKLVAWRAFLFLGATLLALGRIHYAAPFAIVSGVVLTANLNDVFAARFADFPRRDALNCAVLALFFFLLLSVPTQGWSLIAGERHRFGFGENPSTDRFPEAAARFAATPGMPTTAFVAPLGAASVYAYHNAPTRTLFADPRLAYLTRETVDRYEELLERMDIRSPDFHQSAPWEASMRQPDGTYPAILLNRRTHLRQIRGLIVTYNWRLVYADRKAALFIHRDVAEQLGLDRADAGPLFVAE